MSKQTTNKVKRVWVKASMTKENHRLFKIQALNANMTMREAVEFALNTFAICGRR